MTTHPGALTWLLEDDEDGVRFLTLRDLVRVNPNDDTFITSRKKAYSRGHIGSVLRSMHTDGYWKRPGGGYNPKYFSGVWSLILLSQLGANVDDDPRIKQACVYYMDHALSKDGSLSYNGTPSGTIDCLQGNMCAAFTRMGFYDERLMQTFDWMARSVTGKDVRYYAYKCGPNFACGANGKKPCAWGAVKVILALGRIPARDRTKNMQSAIEAGAEFLLCTDPVKADYPTRTNSKPNRGWWKFGFPVFYMTDILQIAEALAGAGYGSDPRLRNAIDYISGKQDVMGRWLLEYDYTGKTWGTYGEKGKPNKWVTHRALKVLSMLK